MRSPNWSEAFSVLHVEGHVLTRKAGFHMRSNIIPGAPSPLGTMHAEMQKVRCSGNADADFASLMIPHHQGAIEMSKVELQFGTDPRLRRLAQEIIVTQQSEIEVMKGTIGRLPLSSLNLKRKNWCTR